jgi:hypothetical protein
MFKQALIAISDRSSTDWFNFKPPDSTDRGRDGHELPWYYTGRQFLISEGIAWRRFGIWKRNHKQ